MTAPDPKTRAGDVLAAAWQRRGVLAWALWPLSVAFGAVAALRRFAFRRGWRAVQRVGVPVVIVGNVTVGGTGKTPAVIALVKALADAGFTPGVISRGYGVRILAPTPVSATGSAAAGGDEPLLIARRTAVPVWVCPDRVAAARALLRAHPDVDVIVSDDGLQHYRLVRDVELVVFDQRLGGNGFLLPAGPLREPLGRRRDATLINTSSDAPLPAWPATFRMHLAPGAAWQLVDPSQRRALDRFADQRVVAAAGIGSPERFFATLRAAGLSPLTLPLPDHYGFETDPFARLDAQVVLITEKDAVKCDRWRDPRIWVVPVEAELDTRVIALVVEKIRGRPPA